jgi:hypothetical protein
MFPSNEIVLAAESDYRRERLTAVRPRRRFRMKRRFWPSKVRTAPERGHYVTAA